MIEFFGELKQQLFIPVFEYFLLLLVMVIGIRKRRRFPTFAYFPLYAGCLIFVAVTTLLYYEAYLQKFQVNFFNGLMDYSDYFFTLLELFLLSRFYIQTIGNLNARKLIVVFNLLFLPFFFYMAITDRYFYEGISERTQSIVYTVEAMMLLLICSIYFVEVIRKPSVHHLKQEPAFWVSIGVLIFMGGTLPYSLMENYIRRRFPENHLLAYSIFHLFYIFLFLMVLRAYYCKPEVSVGENKTVIEEGEEKDKVVTSSQT